VTIGLAIVGRKRIRCRRESRHATPLAISSAAVSYYRNTAGFDVSPAPPQTAATEEKMLVTLAAQASRQLGQKY